MKPSRSQVENAHKSAAAINRSRAHRDARPSEDFDWDRAIEGLKRIFDDIEARHRRKR